MTIRPAPTLGWPSPSSPAVGIRLILGEDVATATVRKAPRGETSPRCCRRPSICTTSSGREKADRLPCELSIDGARREFDYEVAETAYWSAGNDFEMTNEPLD